MSTPEREKLGRQLADAVFDGKIQETLHLLKQGANPNVQGANGETPLYIACSREDERLVTLLLEEYGADPNTETGSGQRPLDIAVSNGYKGIVRKLLTHGADPLLVEDGGIAPLDRAKACGEKKIKEILIKKIRKIQKSFDPPGTPAANPPSQLARRIAGSRGGVKLTNEAIGYVHRIARTHSSEQPRKVETAKEVEFKKSVNLPLKTLLDGNPHDQWDLDEYLEVVLKRAKALSDPDANEAAEKLTRLIHDGKAFEPADISKSKTR